jgi:N-acetylmuramoyl-L-alanine amidase
LPKSIRIIVIQGHRNTSGGNPEEASRTPAIANAIVAALKSAGHDAFCLQHADGKPDDWFAGTLDAVARRVTWHYTQQPIDLMLDIHLEGNPANTPGIFTIIPDGDGLRTLTHYDGSDSAASNERDRSFAEAISQRIAQATGLPLRRSNVIAPGVMSERQTHAGADLGWRLAMFGYTAPVRERMSRLVIECGNIVADRKIIDSPGFPERVAHGVVAGIASVLGNQLPAEPVPLKFPPFGTIGVLRDLKQVNVTAHKLRARIYAETSQPIAMELTRGSNFPAGGWIIGESIEDNPVWWIVGDSSAKDSRWRVWSGGTDLQGLDILKLPAV